MDSFMRRRRFHLPKRTSELIALLAISSTLFLFLHTRDLSTQLQQMRGRLPLSANQLTAMERRTTRVSEAQWSILLEFLERNPSLARARGYNNSSRGRAESHQPPLWQEVSDALNAEGSGPAKTPKEWSVYVSNYKSKIKKIVADINADASGTGGGPPGGSSLSELDNRFLALLGPGFGQTAPSVRVNPFPNENPQQPSTSAMPQTLDVVVEIDEQQIEPQSPMSFPQPSEVMTDINIPAPADGAALPLPRRTRQTQYRSENSGNSLESGIAGTLAQDNSGFDKNLISKAVLPHPRVEYLPPSKLNNTQYADTDVVFFNRVPKVGSQTIMELLRRLSMINNFGFNRDNIQRVEYIRLAPSDQLQLALQVAAFEPPSVYIKHVCFTNFTQFGLPEPIYLNLVRDPVERVISWYYYVRAPWYYVERKQAFPDLPLPEPAWLKKDFESCVLNGDRECRYIEGERHEGIGDHRRQSLFFCGHDDECTPFNTLGALERAKYAVERHYAVVGVLEDINATLTVLENYIPKFFKGASNVYWSEVNNFVRINRNNFKPPVSEHVKDIVRKNFTREIEFYQFCRQRLHKQLYALKLPETTTQL